MKEPRVCQGIKEGVMEYLRSGDVPDFNGRQKAHIQRCVRCTRRYSAAQLAWESWNHPRDVTMDTADEQLLCLERVLSRVIGLLQKVHGRTPEFMLRVDYYLLHEAILQFMEGEVDAYLPLLPGLLPGVIRRKYPRPRQLPPPPPGPRKQ